MENGNALRAGDRLARSTTGFAPEIYLYRDSIALQSGRQAYALEISGLMRRSSRKKKALHWQNASFGMKKT